MSQPLRVALIQAPPVFLNLVASAARATDLISDAARQGAQLAVFPEAWLTGYPVWLDAAPGAALWGHAPSEALHRRLFLQSPEAASPEIGVLVDAAGRARIDVVIGLHERRGGSLFNAMLFIGADGERRWHRKLTPTFNERLIWGQGDGSTLGVWPRPYGNVGGLVCWEHWMPLARAAMHAQGEAVHIAQWPAVGELHQLASRHYAFEGQCFVLASGGVLSRDDVLDGFDSLPDARPEARELLEAIPADRPLLKNGGSTVIAPDASYVVPPAFDDPATIFAEIDLATVGAGRLYLDTHGHYARPDIFELLVDTRERTGVRAAVPSANEAPAAA